MLGKGWRTSQKAENTSRWQLFPQKPEKSPKTVLYGAVFMWSPAAGSWAESLEQGSRRGLHLHSAFPGLPAAGQIPHPTSLSDSSLGWEEEIKDWALESVTALWAFHIYCSRASQDLNGSVLHSFIYHLQLICLFTMPREGTDAQLHNLTCRTVLSVQHFTRCKPGILASGATFSFTLITPL